MIRVGAVNYLNTKPLIEGLAGFSDRIELSLDLPSKLADRLAAGELDVGLIPVIEFFRAGTYSMIPNVAIGSRGPVLSVTLFSKVPWGEIRSVALDEGSRTSAALTKILLSSGGKFPNLPPEDRNTLTSGSGGSISSSRQVGKLAATVSYRQLPIDADPESAGTDAVLLIGDRAMKACLPSYEYAYDLGQEWTDRTGLPMVFAVWAVRDGVDLGSAETAFVRAKNDGLAKAGLIAAREAKLLGLDAGYCRRYFTNIIHYDLGPVEMAGLNRFYQLAANAGLAPEGVELETYHRPNLVACR